LGFKRDDDLSSDLVVALEELAQRQEEQATLERILTRSTNRTSRMSQTRAWR
jgi:hypothetical protein